ncbi:hypothetical protein LO762_12580 [Actinocorallia sp. API 0066]|uniref:preprotein translocase subunit SecY n=1 Tax=Actinocorallia sp. API 0066 TaxID=2896846 RepID=UPI001E5C144B|nr:hypothetical protein [Actinocorallia sp. API 0066]MCD0450022.1 hypothetical protein [Actinocorallia sp. API 0066]
MHGITEASRWWTKAAVTVLAIVLYRVGQALPSPGVDVAALSAAADAAVRTDPFYGLAELFSGGGLLRLSVFGLGVLPFAAATFIVQLLVLTVPRMRALATAGRPGIARIERYIRILTLVLGALAGTGVAFAAAQGHFPGGEVLTGTGVPDILLIAACMTAGTAATTWLIRLISVRGFGDGLTVLFFVQLAAVFPGLLLDVRATDGDGVFVAASLAVLVSAALVVVAVTVLGRAERRVPVQYARRMIGRRTHGGTPTYIPIRVDDAGLFPMLTVAALLHVPAVTARLWPGGGLPDGVWTLPRQASLWFLAALFVLVALLTFLRAPTVTDHHALTRRLQREGAFVPAIRPGRPTAEYLDYVRTRVGALTPLTLGAVAVLPYAALALAGAGATAPVTGTAVLVLVSSALTTVSRVLGQAGIERQIRLFAPFLPPSPRTTGDG